MLFSKFVQLAGGLFGTFGDVADRPKFASHDTRKFTKPLPRPMARAQSNPAAIAPRRPPHHCHRTSPPPCHHSCTSLLYQHTKHA